MKTCKTCGFHNVDTNERCLRCGCILESAADASRVTTRTRLLHLSQFLLYFFLGLIERVWRWTPLRRLWELPAHPLPYRYPWLAAALTLVPPFGQLYNRQIGKALLLGGLFWAWAFLCVETLREPWSNAALFAWLIYWIWLSTDAFATAVRINGEPWSERNTVAVAFAMAFYTGLIITACQYLLPALFVVVASVVIGFMSSLSRLFHQRVSWKLWCALGVLFTFVLLAISLVRGSGRIYAFVTIHDDIGEGDNGLHRGDMLLVSYSAYWFREPQLGEVVEFDPPAFSVRKASGLTADMWLINIKNYYQRIVAIGGDEVEVSTEGLRRNGDEVKGDLLPFGHENMSRAQLRLTVPRGHYFVPITTIPRYLFSVSPPPLFAAGYSYQGWIEACLVPPSAISGKVIAIVNPPTRRRWF